MPADLGEQIPYVRRMLDAMRIPILEYPRIRSRRCHRHDRAASRGSGDLDVVIVSSDKDMLQLVDRPGFHAESR